MSVGLARLPASAGASGSSWKGKAVASTAEIVSNYVAVWNEGDAVKRRRCIEDMWAADGTTCFRLLDAHGYDAIEKRVTGSWEKWLTEGKYRFEPKSWTVQQDAIKVEFVLVRRPGGEVEANGLSFLLLHPDGRIRHDLQFNPSANDATEIADRQLAVMNAPDRIARRMALGAFWSADGELINEFGVARGIDQIEEHATRLCEAVPGASKFISGDRSQAHHNIARTRWQAAAADGSVVAIWTDLLIFDEAGRVRTSYRFRD